MVFVLGILCTMFLPCMGNGMADKPKLHIIYSPSYNITFWGLQNAHPFDAAKYGHVYDSIMNPNNHVPQNALVWHTPAMVTDEQLSMVHTQRYLDSLRNSGVIARITELPFVRMIPNFIVRSKLLNPMKCATGGTILGGQLALDCSTKDEPCTIINLSGGYHHAKADGGEGFCVYADIPLAVHALWKQEKYKNLKVLVLDLDAHQGNGHEAIFAGDPRVAIFDIYNDDIYPHDLDAQRFITFNYPVHAFIRDEQYLAIVKQELPRAIAAYNPDLIIYNAGTDIYREDPIGRMSISQEAIIERDAFVFEQARVNKKPILMLLSGGYTKKSAEIIGQSIGQIVRSR